MVTHALVGCARVSIEAELEAGSSSDPLYVESLGVALAVRTLFRSTFSMPAHQYVVRRRVERARVLLLSSDMPISQIALEAGFSHQSHMPRCMRHVLARKIH